MPRFLSIMSAAGLAGLSPALAAEPESVYTKLDFNNNCIALSTYEAGGTFTCNGYKGYPVILSEGDLRQSVFFGHVGPWFKGADGSEAFVSFGPFNGAGETIEWRLDAEDVPFATILRWTIAANGGDDTVPGHSVLVVSRVGQPGVAIGCPVGFVDAGLTPDANTVARKLADAVARDFDCGVSEPQWHGIIPADPPSQMSYYPEQANSP
ncbi:MAG: hypothetical protein MUC58_00650 [Rhizobiaceae bacterium]|jgi:hypothetical protein|nr:hypothetical protein [Rhizobiaceae bacterium]